jgi:exosortase/archaeosortase family protein
MQEKYLIPIKIVLVYVVWKVFHGFAAMAGTPLNLFWIDLVFKVGTIYATCASFFLTLIGMKAVGTGITINLLESHRQVLVQDHCLAIPAMVVFAGSVMIFKGSLREKTWFVLAGLIGIFFINVIRLIFVSYTWVYFSQVFFEFDHSLIYVVFTYGFIFFMIARWMDHVIKKEADLVKA